MMLHPPPPLVPEMVKAEGIVLRFYNPKEARLQCGKLRPVQLTLEDRVLHPLAVIEAGFCNPAQTPGSAFARGGNIVGDQYIHDGSL